MNNVEQSLGTRCLVGSVALVVFNAKMSKTVLDGVDENVQMNDKTPTPVYLVIISVSFS